jgi:hypothetical protein
MKGNKLAQNPINLNTGFNYTYLTGLQTSSGIPIKIKAYQIEQVLKMWFRLDTPLLKQRHV